MVFSKVESKKALLKAWGAFILVVVTSLFASASIIVINNQNELVLHSDKVLHQVVKIEKLVIDMETATRGFLLTGKEYFLEPYNLALNKIDNHLAGLEELVIENEDQLNRAQEIKKRIAQWDQGVAVPEITSRRLVEKKGIDAEYLQELIGRKTGKSLQTRIQERVGRLNDHFKKKNLLKGRFLALQVARSMVDIERGQRGFLLTGNEDFLEPYDQGKLEFEKHFLALVRYTKAQRKSAEILKEIELIKQDQELWLEKAGIPAILARRKMNSNTVNMKSVIALVETEKGKNMMDDLRQVFGDFSKEEQKLRDKNITIATVVTHSAYLYCFLASLIAAVLAFFTLTPKEEE